jgi:hypothetical protein
MSFGCLPEARYAKHSVAFFKTSLRTNTRALPNGRQSGRRVEMHKNLAGLMHLSPLQTGVRLRQDRTKVFLVSNARPRQLVAFCVIPYLL